MAVGWLALMGALTHAQGQPLVPIIKNVQVGATVSYDSIVQTYTYQYQISTASTNTGDVYGVDIDITTNLPIDLSTIQNPVPEYRSAVVQSLDKSATKIIPVTMTAPDGWYAVNLTAHGTASWGEKTHAPTLGPGQSMSGFVLESSSPPGIRTITLYPDITTWGLYPDADDLPEVQAQRDALIDSLNYVGATLGPVAISGIYEHWNHLRDDLARAIQLGWIPDAALANSLVMQLAAARQSFVDANDGTTAKQRLQALLATLAQSTPAQRRQEAYDLVFLNVNGLLANTPDTPVPYEPKLTLSPKTAELPLGELYTLTATVINLGDNTPIHRFMLSFIVSDGPHAGLSQSARTDDNGQAFFEYTGTMLGTDKIRVSELLAFNAPGVQVAAAGDLRGLMLAQLTPAPIEDEARVTWTGGPDLVVPLFIPPVIDNAQSGQTVFITEETANTGTTAADFSTTRYYLSPNPPPFDPNTVRAIGQRDVPGLAPDVRDHIDAQPFVLPGDLPAGQYYLAACADADNLVAELDETNNCSFNPLASGQTMVVPLSRAQNLPPDCSAANSDPAQLWPPNHKLVTIGIQGVTDPDGDTVTPSIIRITQDEPVNGLGVATPAPMASGPGKPRPSCVPSVRVRVTAASTPLPSRAMTARAVHAAGPLPSVFPTIRARGQPLSMTDRSTIRRHLS